MQKTPESAAKGTKRARAKKVPPTFGAQVKRKLKTFERDARREFERAVDLVLDRLGLVRKSKLETA